MRELSKAIYVHYQKSSPTLHAQIGGLWHHTAPAWFLGKPFKPAFIVWHFITSVPLHTMGGPVEQTTIQFSLYAKVMSLMWTVYEALETDFNNSTLVYPTKKHVLMRREAETGPERFEDKTWMITVDYHAMYTSL